MFPGKRAAIMLNPLSLPTEAIYRREPLPFPIGFTDQARIGRCLRTENMEELMYLYTVAIVYSSWLTTPCRGRSLFHDKLFLRGGILDRGLRLVPQAWSMISRNSRTPALRLLFSTLSMDTAHMSRT